MRVRTLRAYERAIKRCRKFATRESLKGHPVTVADLVKELGVSDFIAARALGV